MPKGGRLNLNFEFLFKLKNLNLALIAESADFNISSNTDVSLREANFGHCQKSLKF